MLQDVDGRNEVRTISEPTLTDPDYYSPVAPPAASASRVADRGAERSEPAAPAERSVAPVRASDPTLHPEGDDGLRDEGSWLGDLGLPGIRSSGAASRAR